MEAGHMKENEKSERKRREMKKSIRTKWDGEKDKMTGAV
jgi:hypothetical protein